MENEIDRHTTTSEDGEFDVNPYTLSETGKITRQEREQSEHAFLSLMNNLEEARKQAGNFCITVGRGRDRAVLMVNPVIQEHETESLCTYMAITKEGLFGLTFKERFDFGRTSFISAASAYLKDDKIHNAEPPPLPSSGRFAERLVDFHEYILTVARRKSPVDKSTILGGPADLEVSHLEDDVYGTVYPQFFYSGKFNRVTFVVGKSYGYSNLSSQLDHFSSQDDYDNFQSLIVAILENHEREQQEARRGTKAARELSQIISDSNKRRKSKRKLEDL